MKNLKYFFLFLAFTVTLSACSKSNDPAPQEEEEEADTDHAFYSLKIEIDEDNYNPEWVGGINGVYMGHEKKDLGIKPYDFDKELDESLEVIGLYSTRFTAESFSVEREIHLEFDQKGRTVIFGFSIDNIESDEQLKGKLIVLKDEKVVKEYPLTNGLLIAYPSED